MTPIPHKSMKAVTGARQRGAVTIFISIMLLLLITVLVLTAYSLSTTNMRVVSNVQAREESIAAANFMIEEKIQSNFWNLTTVSIETVDINWDDTTDYVVELQKPKCVRAVKAGGSTSSSVTLPGMTVSDAWQTVWELDATATQAATGAEVQIIQGVRVLMSSTLKDTHCI